MEKKKKKQEKGNACQKHEQQHNNLSLHNYFVLKNIYLYERPTKRNILPKHFITAAKHGCSIMISTFFV